jgi:FMN reductase
LFKSFFDVLDPETLAGKPVLIGATGGTARHSLALEHAIRPLLTYLKAATIPTAVFAATEDWGSAATPARTAASSAGSSRDALTARIHRAGAELAAAISQRQPTAKADPYATPPAFEQLLQNH